MSDPKDNNIQSKQNETEQENVYPVHQYTKLLGKGTWQSREPELIPKEGDELEIPKHHEIPKI